MLRWICGLAALSASLLFVVPASAEPGRELSGSIVSISSTQVKVKGARITARCAVTDDSPSVARFAQGDRVHIACAHRPSGFVLTRIRRLPAPNADTDPTRAEFAGAITALSADSISLHDGDRDLRCAITTASPSRGEAKVGDHARVVCTGGVLTVFQPIVIRTVPPPAPPAPPATPAPDPGTVTPALVAYGLITALDVSSLTIHSAEHGDLTCTLGERSPRLGDFHVGDRVKVGCTDGRVLVAIARY
jgi:hypothetical protein